MDVMGLLRIVRHRFYAVLLVMGITGVVLMYRLNETPLSYESTVKLQITAPLTADVELYSTYRSTNLRDDMTVARNNFTELLQSREVYIRTIKELDIKGADATFGLDTTATGDSDFLYVMVRARSPDLAERVANTIVNVAIGYYGEVRSKPTTAEGNSLRTQLTNSEKQYHSAEEAVSNFERAHNIGPLDSEISIANSALERLITQRNELLLQGKPTTAVDGLINIQRDNVRTLSDLLPDYKVLQENAQQARASYELLLNKYQEAVLKEDSVRAASFVQVVEPAIAPDRPAPLKLQAILILWLAGSIALGVLLALLLEFFARRQPAASLKPSKRSRATEQPNQSRVSVASTIEEKANSATPSRWFT